MRKHITILAVCLAATILAGCGTKEEAEQAPIIDTASSAVQQSDASSSQNLQPSSLESTETAAQSEEDEVDVDLTQLSSIMCYSEVYTMITYPEQYEGKTIKMSGDMAYSMSYGEEPQYYFAVLISDALACCQQGIEFVLESASGDPADYPAIGSQVTVVGEFTSYEQNGMTFVRLVNAKVLPKENA